MADGSPNTFTYSPQVAGTPAGSVTTTTSPTWAAPSPYPGGPPVVGTTGVVTNVNAPPEKHETSHKIGWGGALAGTIALILVIVLIVLLFVFPGNKNTTSGFNGTYNVIPNSGTTQIFTGSRNNVFANQSSTATTWTIKAPVSPAVGQSFIIDNISGGGPITLIFQSDTGGPATTTPGLNTIRTGERAQYMWTSQNTLHTFWSQLETIPPPTT